jgi:hypothetical protein
MATAWQRNQTNHTQAVSPIHQQTNAPTVMPCFLVFVVFRGSMAFGNKSQYVVETPQYRAAANTAMG